MFILSSVQYSPPYLVQVSWFLCLSCCLFDSQSRLMSDLFGIVLIIIIFLLKLFHSLPGCSLQLMCWKSEFVFPLIFKALKSTLTLGNIPVIARDFPKENINPAVQRPRNENIYNACKLFLASSNTRVQQRVFFHRLNRYTHRECAYRCTTNKPNCVMFAIFYQHSYRSVQKLKKVFVFKNVHLILKILVNDFFVFFSPMGGFILFTYIFIFGLM